MVGLQILIYILRYPLAFALGLANARVLLGLVAVVNLLVLLVVSVLIAVAAYRLSEHLDIGPPILWAIAMFLPCLNIIFLLILSAKAQTWCRQYGIAVGFLGPSKESIEEIRRRSVGADFE
jgi:hypothetical protein